MIDKYSIDPPPEHLKRNKAIYDRYMAGEYFTEIAEDMGLSVARVRQLYARWVQQIHRFNRMQMDK